MISLPIGVVLFAISAGLALCRELHKAAGDMVDSASPFWVIPAVLWVGAALINVFMIVKVFLYFFTFNF